MSATEVASTSPRAQLGRLVRRDSIWILLGYGVTSASGFLFWLLAARLVPAHELGIDTAIYSVFTAAAAIASAGMGDALLVMLPIAGRDARHLLRLGLLVAVGVSLVAGVVAGWLVSLLVGGPALLVIVVIALVTVGWTFYVLKDPVLQSFGRANRTVVINGSSNLAKLAVLPVLVLVATSITRPAVVSILVPVLLATAVAWAIVIPRSFRSSERIVAVASDEPPSADWPALRRRFLIFALRDGSASGLYLATLLCVPYLVTALGGAEEGALLALCTQLVSVLDLVALAVGSAFSTHAATHDGHGGDAVIGVWLRVLAIVGPGAAAMVALAPLVLWAFGDEYLRRGGVAVMALLATASLLRTAYELWGASLRARQSSAPLLLTSALHAALLLPLAVLLVPRLGAIGAALGSLGGAVVLAAIGLSGMLLARRRRRRTGA